MCKEKRGKMVRDRKVKKVRSMKMNNSSNKQKEETEKRKAAR